MSWEISMSAEGWEAIRDSLNTWTLMDLSSALAMADTEEYVENPLEDLESYEIQRTFYYEGLPQDILVDIALDRIRQHNTCNNGGNVFWIDREGYRTVEIP